MQLFAGMREREGAGHFWPSQREKPAGPDRDIEFHGLKALFGLRAAPTRPLPHPAR
jgi:hypothetical protein